MVTAAPTIPLPLVRTLARAAHAGVVYADVWRAVGAEADRRELTRPSYQQVRVLARELIGRRARRRAIVHALLEGAVDPHVARGLWRQEWALVRVPAAAAEALGAGRSYRARARK